jgi:hypothetical protein
MEVSTTPAGHTGLEARLDVRALHLLIAHEFGHVLGLGHCFDCDSAMNYSWETLDRVMVTEADVRAFRALIARPSGKRVDGRPLSWLPEDALPDDVPRR